MKKIISILIISLFLVLSVQSAIAQNDETLTEPTEWIEESNESITQEKNESEEAVLDETITEEDLGAKTPGTFHFLKRFTRTIQKAITRDPIKKAELDLEEAHEELLRAKKIAEENPDDEKAAEKAEQAIEKFEEKIQNVKNRAGEIKEKKADQAEKFLEKIADAQIKQQKMLDKLEEKLPDAAFEKIQQARERALEHAAEVFTKIAENKEQIAEKINEAMENQNGSEFKDIKNMEIIERLREYMPEETKEAIEQVKEAAKKRFEEKIEQMPAELRNEKFEKYIENINGDAISQMKVLEEIKESPNVPKNFNAQIEKAVEKAMVKFQEKAQKMESQGQIDLYLKNLETGDIKTMQAVDQLRQHMPNEIKEQLELKNEQAMQNLKEKIESSSSPEAFESIKTQLEKTPQIQRGIQQKYTDFKANLNAKQSEIEEIKKQQFEQQKTQEETKQQTQNQTQQNKPYNTQNQTQPGNAPNTPMQIQKEAPSAPR